MTQQDKDLLLLDLSARLPYKVMVCVNNDRKPLPLKGITFEKESKMFNTPSRYACEIGGGAYSHIYVKSYLRPLSNLTQEERDKFCDIGGVISHRPDGKLYLVAYFPEALDYLNSIHADYRGMIEKGLAIEVTDENNPYK